MRGHPDFNKIRQWLETVPALTAQDADRTKKFLTPLDNPSLVEIRRQFYSIVNMPLQNVCTVGKFFGGIWMDNHGCLDGHKYVCMDKFYGDIISGNCLIYSFGIFSCKCCCKMLVKLTPVIQFFGTVDLKIDS